MFIESYMDESGIHDTARICTVAGYYGTQVAWRKFEREWVKVLQGKGLETHGFHSKEFWGMTPEGKRIKPYQEWTDPEADKFIERLVQVILRNRIFPFGHGIIVKHWFALPLEDRRMMTGGERWNGRLRNGGCPNKCYYVPFLFAVLDSARLSGATEKVHYFAGLDKTFSGYARDLYQRLVTKGDRLPIRHLLGTISFPLSKDTCPLQAADLLAYQLYRHNVSRFAGEVTKTSVLRQLIAKRLPKQGFQLFDFENLCTLRDQMRSIPV